VTLKGDAMRQPDFTLTAGPTQASPRVLAALGSPITYDYDPVFLERFRGLERKVGQIFETRSDVVLMQGEAVLGLEAAARALVRPGAAALNLASGVYGKWFGLWLAEYGATLHEIEVPYDESVDPADVERALAEHPEIELVAFVHSETPSGTLNPAAEIGRVAKAHGAIVIADVVSSLAGEELRPDEWGLDLCVAGPQKCLAGPPGMSLVTVAEAAWERIRANPAAPRGSFLSLLDWKERWIDGGRTAFPYTPSVSDVHGVEAACDEVLELGVDESVATHRRAARATRAGVRAMGLELWAKSEEISASCVTAVRTPEGVDTLALLAHVRERYGVMLSPGYGELKEKVIRLGHMGPAARSLNPVVALSALGRGLADIGTAVSVGDGVEAALEVLSESPVAA
jgi:pyridoxamine--pyruvate transaminase